MAISTQPRPCANRGFLQRPFLLTKRTSRDKRCSFMSLFPELTLERALPWARKPARTTSTTRSVLGPTQNIATCCQALRVIEKCIPGPVRLDWCSLTERLATFAANSTSAELLFSSPTHVMNVTMVHSALGIQSSRIDSMAIEPIFSGGFSSDLTVWMERGARVSRFAGRSVPGDHEHAHEVRDRPEPAARLGRVAAR
jgi:hypothetical protein